MKHVVMLVSNACAPDPRVDREATVLVQAGYRVTVVAWDREGRHAPNEMANGYTVERIQQVHTVHGAGARQLLHTPRFWRVAVRRALALLPDVIHCHDLDTLPVGWWLKRRTGARLVYDAHEDYPVLMAFYLPRPMVWALAWLERRLLRRVDYTITACHDITEKLVGNGVKPVATIGNYQSLELFDVVAPAEEAAARARLGLAPDDYVLAYIGGFSRTRLLQPLLEAARDLPDVQVLLWGDGHQRLAVEQAAAELSNVRYLGWLPSSQVPLYMRAADVIYYCLVPGYPGWPNTLSNAMAAGRPLIANDVGDLGRIVRETGCGVLLAEVTPAAIRQAVEVLRDPATRRRMGQAGRAAAEREYNWSVASRRLVEVYAQLERGKGEACTS